MPYDKMLQRVTISLDISCGHIGGFWMEDRWKVVLAEMKNRANDYAEKRMGTEAAIMIEMARVFQIGLDQIEHRIRSPLPTTIIKKEDSNG